jgi:ATP-binding cassette subfamily C protein
MTQVPAIRTPAKRATVPLRVTVAKVFGVLDRRTRGRLGGIFVLMVLSSLLEMVSLTLIVPLAKIVFDPGALPPAVAEIKRILGLDGTGFVIAACGGFALLYLFKQIVLVGITWIINHFTAVRLAAFQRRLYQHYLDRPLAQHFHDHSATIIRNLTTSAPAIFLVLRCVLTLLLDGLIVLVLILVLMVSEPLAALSGAGLFIAVLTLYHRTTSDYFHQLGHEASLARAGVLRWAIQGMGALKDIKVLRCSDFFTARFGTEADTLGRVQSIQQVASILPRSVVEGLIVIIAMIGMIVFHARAQRIEDMVALMALVAIVALRLLPSLNRILATVSELRHYAVEVSTLDAALDEGVTLPDPQPVTAMPPLDFGRELRLDGITYSYKGAERPALNGIDLSIRPGETIGIIGSSGAGKSTLVDLLLGLLTPAAGRVSVDGIDAATNLAGWQANLGFVPQSIYLLDESVRRNVAFGLPDSAIDEERFRQTLDMAHLDQVIKGLPHGADSFVGEGGVRLSGGQRQRVGIARALYRDPAILLFDEATSALDNESEQEIVSAIGELKGRKTIIIVAHRLSTVKGCDRVYVLAQGRVVDSGTLAELLARNPSLDPGGTNNV